MYILPCNKIDDLTEHLYKYNSCDNLGDDGYKIEGGLNAIFFGVPSSASMIQLSVSLKHPYSSIEA